MFKECLFTFLVYKVLILFLPFTRVEQIRDKYACHVQVMPEAVMTFDDVPVRGMAGSGKRTFEEMLEDELRKQGQQEGEDVASPRANGGSRHFLKKGEGLSRFQSKPKTPTSAAGSKTSVARSTPSSAQSSAVKTSSRPTAEVVSLPKSRQQSQNKTVSFASLL